MTGHPHCLFIRLRGLLVLQLLACIGLSALAEETPASKESEPPKPATVTKEFPELPAPSPATAEEGKRIGALIELLGDEAFEKRRDAAKELRAFGLKARAQLQHASETTKDSEVYESVKGMLADLDGEFWEGYYYYSNESFEDACQHQVVRVRFWMRVKRLEDGSFTANADESAAELGASTIAGKVERASGEMKFKKKYSNMTTNEWEYAGTWSDQKGRIEGSYGNQSGGFVLYPRRLTEAELKTFEAGNAQETVIEQGDFEIIEE